MFKPKIKSFEITDEDETQTFHCRQPSGREILEFGDKYRGKEPSVEQQIDMFRKFMVNEDGSPVTKEFVDDVVDSRYSAFKQIMDVLMEQLGLNKKPQEEAEKKS